MWSLFRMSQMTYVRKQRIDIEPPVQSLDDGTNVVAYSPSPGIDLGDAEEARQCKPPNWGKPGEREQEEVIRLWEIAFNHKERLDELKQKAKDPADKLSRIRWRNVEDSKKRIKEDFSRVVGWFQDSSYHHPLSDLVFVYDYPAEKFFGMPVGVTVSNWECFLWVMGQTQSMYEKFFRVSKEDANYRAMGSDPMRIWNFDLARLHCEAVRLGAPRFYINMLYDVVHNYMPQKSGKRHSSGSSLDIEGGAFTMGSLGEFLPPYYKMLWSKHQWPKIHIAILIPGKG